MSEGIIISEWSDEWPQKFLAKAARIREAMGDHAVRIDHIGSTSIQGLAAKPVIDIQVSVQDLQATELLQRRMMAAGYEWRQSNPELTKRYFREQPGDERTHVHIRRAGSWNEQWALLFRDFMRIHHSEHDAYAKLKRELAARFGNDRHAYTAGKSNHFWGVIRRADDWASKVGWQPGLPDA